MPRKPTSLPVRIDLALQGGGSHGAFTWGVLDRLLDDDSIEFAGISGTSAGALNAAVMATGLAEGGRAGAQRALAAFWADVASRHSPWGGCFGPVGGAGFGDERPLAAFNLDGNPWYWWSQWLLRWASPYQFNPAGPNPLAAVVERHVRPERLAHCGTTVFVTATSVHTGQPRVFTGGEDLTHEALLASACLPHLFRAVEIDGEPYWDGGYSGNPALWPLVYDTDVLDVMLVKINPLLRRSTPDTPAEIADRVAEITFNAGLVAEMRAIGFVSRLVQEGRLDPGVYKNLRLHMVADDDGLAPLAPSSKLNTERAFLERLHRLGREAADRWLDAHRADLGRRGTLDLRATFLAPRRAATRPGTAP